MIVQSVSLSAPFRLHDRYAALLEKVIAAHRSNRDLSALGANEVAAARLYAHAFRRMTIGAFHATRQALAQRPPGPAIAALHRKRAVESLEDLATEAVQTIPRDFRAALGPFYRYHRGAERALESLAAEIEVSRDEAVARVARRFAEMVEEVTSGNGIVVARDDVAPEQGCFVVPNLGITIVPLVYGDHHSWNLAYLAGEHRDVPLHAHHRGVEIHLGYNPTHGETILGDYRATVDEGYAMPIPPDTNHGWMHRGEEVHHVPFIFGSQPLDGWGIFLDVQPQQRRAADCRPVARDAYPFTEMVYLEREIARAAAWSDARRKVLIPAAATDRRGSGGLELSVARIGENGWTFPQDDYRIVAVVRGEAEVDIEGCERTVVEREHFGVPAGMTARLRQRGTDPLVVLDSVLRSSKR